MITYELTQDISTDNQCICVDIQIFWLDIFVSKNSRPLPVIENVNSVHVSSLHLTPNCSTPMGRASSHESHILPHCALL